MKITETIERECCQQKDMRPYRGKLSPLLKVNKPLFCVHCGQVWIHVSQMDPAGGTETVLEALEIIGGT